MNRSLDLLSCRQHQVKVGRTYLPRDKTGV